MKKQLHLWIYPRTWFPPDQKKSFQIWGILGYLLGFCRVCCNEPSKPWGWYIITQLAVFTTYIPLRWQYLPLIYPLRVLANWVITCYLPPIEGTRKLHWGCFFFFEIVIRLAAFTRASMAFRDRWFVPLGVGNTVMFLFLVVPRELPWVVPLLSTTVDGSFEIRQTHQLRVPGSWNPIFVRV